MRPALLGLLLALGPGCAYRVSLHSDPAGAQVTLPSGQTVSTPAEAQLRWRPFGKQEVTVQAAGYRPLTVDLRKSEIRLSHYLRDAIFRPSTLTGASRGRVTLVLVPEHGSVGTWTADEVP